MSDPNQVKLTFRASLFLRKAILRYKSYRECYETEVKLGLISPSIVEPRLDQIIHSFYYQIMWNDRPNYEWWKDRVISGYLGNITTYTEEEIHEERKRDPNFRKGKKYVQNPEHKKKNRVEDPWRRHQNFIDRRGNQRTGFCCQPKTKKPYCKQSTRDHRAWQRQIMHNEDYDMFVGDTHYINPYMWS